MAETQRTHGGLAGAIFIRVVNPRVHKRRGECVLRVVESLEPVAWALKSANMDVEQADAAARSQLGCKKKFLFK